VQEGVTSSVQRHFQLILSKRLIEVLLQFDVLDFPAKTRFSEAVVKLQRAHSVPITAVPSSEEGLRRYS